MPNTAQAFNASDHSPAQAALQERQPEVYRPFTIFIPAYNAAKTLPAVLERIPSELWNDCVACFVISKASQDNTLEVAESLKATYPKLEWVGGDTNLGYGDSVRTGLTACLGVESETIVCLHGDGQYPPEELPSMLREIQSRNLDILQGSRHKLNTARAGGMPVYKIVGGKVLTWMENRVFGMSMTDYHSGYMLYSRRALETLPIEHLSYYFDFDIEAIAAGRAMGLEIDEVGIPTHYGDEESYLNPWLYGLRCLRVMGLYIIGKYHRLARQTDRG